MALYREDRCGLGRSPNRHAGRVLGLPPRTSHGAPRPKVRGTLTLTHSIWARPDHSDGLSCSDSRNTEGGSPVRPPPPEDLLGQQPQQCQRSERGSDAAQRPVTLQRTAVERSSSSILSPSKGQGRRPRLPLKSLRGREYSGTECERRSLIDATVSVSATSPRAEATTIEARASAWIPLSGSFRSTPNRQMRPIDPAHTAQDVEAQTENAKTSRQEAGGNRPRTCNQTPGDGEIRER